MRPTFLKAPPIFEPFFLFALAFVLAFDFSSFLGAGVGEGVGDIGAIEGEGVATTLAPVTGVVFAERRDK